jgi:penicillin-binding protein 1A
MNKPRIKKYLKTILYLFLIISILSVFGIGWLFFQVSRDAEAHIDRGAIEQTIFSESPVYYDDGKSVIGVFFEKIHGKYIKYDEIPKIYIKALLAAEDRNFFKHHGFDLRALARAMLANIKAGRVVQGGSTLTQQTAKNIFTRQKRSYTAKLKELIQAFLLERRYSKEEILEMYVNQFFQ